MLLALPDTWDFYPLALLMISLTLPFLKRALLLPMLVVGAALVTARPGTAPAVGPPGRPMGTTPPVGREENQLIDINNDWLQPVANVTSLLLPVVNLSQWLMFTLEIV